MVDPDPIRIGLVGCGGRGSGAAVNSLSSAKNVRLIAMADIFPDLLKKSRARLARKKLPGFDVTNDRCFSGFDAYKRILDTDIDIVIFATPPHFRPIHVEAAVEAGKNVFMEKPGAVDPVGVRRIIRAGEKAKKKKLAIVAGTQFRYQEQFQQTMERVHAGDIGKLLAARCYYNTGETGYRRRKGWTDMEYQLRNWHYYCWISGDHIVEQHLHTIDVVNWAMGGHPLRAVAVGGRQKRTAERYGNVYDHFAVDFEYPGGAHAMSLCRQMDRTDSHVGAYFEGSRGKASPYTGRITGDKPWEYTGGKTTGDAYVQEHADLIHSIRTGNPINDARQIAESTLTAILGREAAYTGKSVTWDQMVNSDLDLSPPEYKFGDLPMRPISQPGRKR